MTATRRRRSGLNPRKSPAQSRSAETVQVILEGAARILEERGLPGYTTNAVAERAGVSVGSLYQYFPGKEALTAALVAREAATLIAAARAAAGADRPERGLGLIIRAGVAHQMTRPRLALLLDREESRLQLAETTEAVAREIMTALRALLGRLPGIPVEPEIAAGDLYGLLRGMVDAAGERGERAGDALERRVLRAALGYLGLAPDEPNRSSGLR